MPNYKPDDSGNPGWYQEDPAPVPHHEFTEANQLDQFPFDGEAMSARMDCPNDCGAYCEPADLGEAVDWALGHKCDEPATTPSPVEGD